MKKSKEWSEGYTTALCYIADVFESRANAFYVRKLLRKKDTQLVVNIIDAVFRARDKLAEVGPRNMDLILHKDRTAEFVERKRPAK